MSRATPEWTVLVAALVTALICLVLGWFNPLICVIRGDIPAPVAHPGEGPIAAEFLETDESPSHLHSSAPSRDDVQLHPPPAVRRVLTVRLADRRGEPVAGARIELSRGKSPFTVDVVHTGRTDEDGSVTFPDVTRTTSIGLRHETTPRCPEIRSAARGIGFARFP